MRVIGLIEILPLTARDVSECCAIPWRKVHKFIKQHRLAVKFSWPTFIDAKTKASHKSEKETRLKVAKQGDSRTWMYERLKAIASWCCFQSQTKRLTAGSTLKVKDGDFETDWNSFFSLKFLFCSRKRNELTFWAVHRSFDQKKHSYIRDHYFKHFLRQDRCSQEKKLIKRFQLLLN